MQSSLRKELSGNPTEKDTNTIIKIAEQIIQHNMLNITGDSFYRINGEPLKNTILGLIIKEIFNLSNEQENTESNQEKRKRLIELASILIKRGENIYPESYYYDLLGNCSEISQINVMTFLEFLLQTLHGAEFNTVIEHLTHKQISSDLSQFFKALQTNLQLFIDYNLSFDKKYEYIENIINLFKKLNKTVVTKDSYGFLFIMLAARDFYLRYLNENENKILFKKIMELIDLVIEKLNFSKEEKFEVIFNTCLTQPNFLHKWIKAYPDSIDNKIRPFPVLHFSFPLLTNIKIEKQLHAYSSRIVRENLGNTIFYLKEFIVHMAKSGNTWSSFTYTILNKGQFNVLPLSDIEKNQINNLHHPSTLPKKGLAEIIKFYSGKLNFKYFLGRTMILEDGEKNLIAFKVQKKDESNDKLQTEYHTINYLHEQKKKFELKSNLPEALGYDVLDINQLISFVPAEMDSSSFRKLITENEKAEVYAYKVKSNNQSYFTYLHDKNLSHEEFKYANEIAIHDVLTLLKHKNMVFYQLGDIFHNSEGGRDDGGHYLILVSLLRRTEGLKKHGQPGRVDNWQSGIEFVNLRGTGLADVGDFMLLDDYCKQPYFKEITAPFLLRRKIEEEDKEPVTNFKDRIYAEVIAQLLFITLLTGGKRGFELSKQAKSIEEKEKIWIDITRVLINNAIQTITIMADLPKEEAKCYVESIINAKRLASQMEYWMTTDYSLQDFNISQFRKMYDSIEISVRSYNKKDVIPGLGFSRDKKHQDLGEFNGCSPLDEAHKMFHLIPTIILILQNMKKNYEEELVNFRSSVAKQDWTAAQNSLQSLILSRYSKHEEQKKQVNICKKQFNDLVTKNFFISENSSFVIFKNHNKVCDQFARIMESYFDRKDIAIDLNKDGMIITYSINSNDKYLYQFIQLNCPSLFLISNKENRTSILTLTNHSEIIELIELFKYPAKYFYEQMGLNYDCFKSSTANNSNSSKINIKSTA